MTGNNVKNLSRYGYSNFMDSEWQHYKTAGEQAAAQRDFAAAEAMWSMAVLIAEYFGEQDPRLVFSLDNLGHSLLREQKHKLAKQFLGRAWHLKTRVLGLPQKEVARTLNLIAEICFHEGKYSEAEPLSRWVLEVYEQSYGKEDPRTVGAANNLAVMQRIVQQRAQEQAEQQAQLMQAQQMQQPPQQVLDPQALQQQQLQQAQLQQQQLQSQGQQPGYSPNQQAQFTSQQNAQIQAQQQAIQAQQTQFQSQQNPALAAQQQAVQAQQAQFQSQQNTALSAQEQAHYQAMQQQAQLEAQQQPGQSMRDFEEKQRAYLEQQALLQQAQRDQQQQQAQVGKVPQRFKVSYCEVCGNKMEAEWCIRCTGTSLKPLGGPLDRLT